MERKSEKEINKEVQPNFDSKFWSININQLTKKTFQLIRKKK